jgi:hypothetical protein
MTKFIFEDGLKLTPSQLRKLLAGYKTGVVNLPNYAFVKSIQGVPASKRTTTTIIIIGKTH